jgi:hypothetical protein
MSRDASKQKYVDLDIIEKAQSMVRCGHGDGFISDYLGMVEDQVSRIRAATRTSHRGRPPTTGDGPPIDDERARTTYAENCRQSSEALARAIGRTA